jgi:hypothetical protein
LLLVDRLGSGGGRGEDVVDGAEGDVEVEQVSEQVDDASIRAVAAEGQGQDQLAQPGPGDGQPEEEVIGPVIGRWVEGQIEPSLGAAQLLVDELPADEVLGGDAGNGHAGKGVEGQTESRPWIERLGRADGRGIEG